MKSEKFFQSKKALITLIAASLIVLIALGIRQTFGLFYFDARAPRALVRVPQVAIREHRFADFVRGFMLRT